MRTAGRAIMIALPLLVASGPAQLDPIRAHIQLHRPPASHLREQFIWTQGDAAALDPALQSSVRGQEDKIAPHYFRADFKLQTVPAHATLYLAGPRSATVYLNGTQVLQFADDVKRSKGFHVFTANVAQALRPGKNVIAIEEVRGHSSLHTGANVTINQVTYGEVLLAKIVPRAVALDAPPLIATNMQWRSTLTPAKDWSGPAFDDSTWPHAQALGIPGTNSDFLQWNADAGLYAWPGYTGVSSAMRTLRLPFVTTDGSLATSPAGGLVVPKAPSSITLDFGREISGRIHLVSAASQTVDVTTSYGESAEEALKQPYLGPRTVTVPPHAEAFGPKSAFRYARLTFPAGGSRWSRIDVEGITYPTRYAGSFTSSDPQLNRIWETAAYTAHLCMQEGIWDAPKRDRGRWMGDLDVTGRTISAVFADRALMEATMAQVIGPSPVRRDVNTIAGYSALWITGQADFYRHQGDLPYLRSMHQPLLQLLQVMDAELSPANLFTNPARHKVFVDWSEGFSSDTPEARAATHLEFTLAYKEAAYLLAELGDQPNAAVYSAKANALNEAAQTLASTGTYGTRWQTNAMAVVSGAASPAQREAIWETVLRHVGDPTQTAVVTPYYGFYVLSAMAQLGHRAEALAWMRQYWGGMLAEGATSFWEAYDPHWPKQDFHAALEADGKRGYYVSLAHGWASGPAAWLAEQVLGITPTGPGFRTVTLRPNLAGLAWARGAEPTPRGLLRVDIKPKTVRINLPPGTTATVYLPFADAPVTIDTPGLHIFNAKAPTP